MRFLSVTMSTRLFLITIHKIDFINPIIKRMEIETLGAQITYLKPELRSIALIGLLVPKFTPFPLVDHTTFNGCLQTGTIS